MNVNNGRMTFRTFSSVTLTTGRDEFLFKSLIANYSKLVLKVTSKRFKDASGIDFSAGRGFNLNFPHIFIERPKSSERD